MCVGTYTPNECAYIIYIILFAQVWRVRMCGKKTHVRAGGYMRTMRTHRGSRRGVYGPGEPVPGPRSIPPKGNTTNISHGERLINIIRVYTPYLYIYIYIHTFLSEHGHRI